VRSFHLQRLPPTLRSKELHLSPSILAIVKP
jgi:hypothetical protein